jgi:hemoglobin
VADVDRVQAAVSLLYRRVLDDPRLAPHFEGVDLVRLARHQRVFLAAAVGGEKAYRGRDLRAAHAGLGLDDADVNVMIAQVARALADVGVSESGIQAALSRLEAVRHLIVEPKDRS